MRCPVCGAEVNTGSGRYAIITPSSPEDHPQPYEEHFWIEIFYCTKSDAHMFEILTRVKKEAEQKQ